MKSIGRVRKILYILGALRLFPHLAFYLLSQKKILILGDLEAWIGHKQVKTNKLFAFILLIQQFPELRNIFYMRIGRAQGIICSLILPKLSTLYIFTKSSNIGKGFYIGHGWSTVINAKQIGNSCKVFQNVTIGSKDLREPIIGNNVTITAHSVILGGVTISDNVSIGAGSIVVKDVPANCVVVPSKSVIIKKNGIRIHEEL